MESTMLMRMSFFEGALIFLIGFGIPAVILFFIARWIWRLLRALEARSANRSELLQMKEQLESLRTEVASMRERQEFMEHLMRQSRGPRG